MLVRNYFPQCSQIQRIQWKYCSIKPINPYDLAERFSMSGHGKVQDRLNRDVMTAIVGTTSQGGDKFISHNFDQAHSHSIGSAQYHSHRFNYTFKEQKCLSDCLRRNRRKWRPGLKWITRSWHYADLHPNTWRAVGLAFNFWIFGLASFFYSTEQELDKKLENVSILLSASYFSLTHIKSSHLRGPALRDRPNRADMYPWVRGNAAKHNSIKFQQSPLRSHPLFLEPNHQQQPTWPCFTV